MRNQGINGQTVKGKEEKVIPCNSCADACLEEIMYLVKNTQSSSAHLPDRARVILAVD